jgi:hypothetical protein
MVDLVYCAERDAGDLLIVDATDLLRPARGRCPPAFPGPVRLPRRLDRGRVAGLARIGAVGIDGRWLMAGPNGWDA